MIDRAIKKITEECEKSKFDAAYVAIEEMLTSFCTNTAVAEQILREDKTIKDCLKELEKYAREHQKGNCGCVPPSVAEKIIKNYYGIYAAQSAPAGNSQILDIADFL